jgi:hypothetical protein
MTTHMQHPLPRLLVVLSSLVSGLLSPLAALPAMAQVNVDRRALDPLQPQAHDQQTPEKPAARPPARSPARTTARPTPPLPPAPPAPPRVEPPVVPLAPPPVPVVPPPIAVPARPPIAPGVVAVAPDAPGAVTTIPGGVRATFGPGRSDMNPEMEKSLRAFAHTVPPGAILTVVATAAGLPEDPSTPRRLSLSRGLAVRSLAITEGIVSTRVVVRAIGANPIATVPGAVDGPPDRVDIMLTLPSPPATPAASSPPATLPAATASPGPAK